MNGNANLNANNLTPQNVIDWREKLGIADTPDLTNYAKKDASNLDSANITSWKSKLDIDDIQMQTNENAQNITNIQNSVNNNTTNITNLQNQVNVNSQNISNNTNSISSLQTNLNNEVDALSQLIDANTDDISTNANNITDLKNDKVDKISGKGLSTNDFTNADKTKLDNLSNYDDTALKNRVSQNENDISSLQTNVNNNTTSITNLQSQVNSNTTNINQNSLKITNNTNSIETLATELLETNENVENNANNITQNTTNISSLQSGLSTTNTQLGILNTRVSNVENTASAIPTIESEINTINSNINSINTKDTQQDQSISSLTTLLNNKVDKTRTINGKALTTNITLTASDVGALPDTTVIPEGAKLYTTTGQNTDGAMTQKATTDILDNKANKDLSNVVQPFIYTVGTYTGNDRVVRTEIFSNGSWYRLWASGWKEMGGYINGAGWVQVDLPTTFSTTNYIVVATLDTVVGAPVWCCIPTQYKQTNKFTAVKVYTGGDAGETFQYYACGY